MDKKNKVYNLKYQRIKKINEGSFGKIILCSVVGGEGEYCVLKKFKLSKQQAHDEQTDIISTIKEIQFMRTLNHPNILRSDDIFKIRRTYNGTDYFEQVFVHQPFFLEMSSMPREQLSQEALKVLVKQLLQAVEYLHTQNIIHRDIKPSNIFIDKNGRLILGDMGISRYLPTDKNAQLTGNVVTRLYRPPEILLGSKQYNESVDLWSLGCTIAEFALPASKYFFESKSEIDQLCKVFELRGAANEENWPGCTQLPFFMDFGDIQPQELKNILPAAAPELIEIVDSLLQLCPQKRVSCSELLKNKWVQSANEGGENELKQFAEKLIQQDLKKLTKVNIETE